MIFFLGNCLIASLYVYGAIYALKQFSLCRDKLTTKSIPYPVISTYMLILIALVGGLCLIFNIFRPLAAFLLLSITACASVLLHDFWNQQGKEREVATFWFLSDLAIMGGLLVIMS